MRWEATLPDSRGAVAAELAEQLGLSRSQLVDEALALFVKAVLEASRGHKLVMLDPKSNQPVAELSTPTLSALEWTTKPEALVMPETAIAKMQALIESPPRPGSRLRAAAKRSR